MVDSVRTPALVLPSQQLCFLLLGVKLRPLDLMLACLLLDALK